jgi:hypothetical protein
VEDLRSQGIEVIEVVETYSPGAAPPRVERSGGYRIVRYENVSGWRQEQSLLTDTAGRICGDALVARRKFNQMRKIWKRLPF